MSYSLKCSLIVSQSERQHVLVYMETEHFMTDAISDEVKKLKNFKKHTKERLGGA